MAAHADAGGGGADQEQYNVIDVMASKPKSGQTTRIVTTGDVDEKFWLTHLGEDFKHAIHLQVGGINEEYNRLINRTQNGVHEEVHHEYLPGAEKPGSVAPPTSRQSGSAYHHGFDNRAMAMKQQYLMHQQSQQSHPSQQRFNYAQQHTQHYAQPPTQQQYQQQQHRQHTHQYPQQQTAHRNMYSKPQSFENPRSYIINSSEDQLHAAQSNPAPVRYSEGDRPNHEEEGDSFDSQLNFKSPFNDYGSRPTRDLTYLLYRRGL
ncbi:mediator of RNA polymerase II transcription subunit 9 isoform X2 [Drosophila elegans]|uniref:mediator of RNA polymerase II transcription subunit 9 isoform X2 n=2 Tax=Drosophila elegans TaxID=30023 RepID=UPI0007E5C5EB|nr:mediator of RNA polymerase II transcription subunit 9 isoform X2 [Drosophila elegans]